MFVGWIRRDRLANDLENFSKEVLIDKNLLLQSIESNGSLSFAIYDGDLLCGIISAYEFDSYILVNNLYYTDGVDDRSKTKLVELLLTNIGQTDKTILFLAHKKEVDIFKQYEFKQYAPFYKATYSGGAVFNFSNATAKTISGEDYISVVKKLDTKAFGEDRFEYITKVIAKQSTLMLSTNFGFQHSYALDKKNIKISPFVMVDDAFNDAEKLLRGVIYHRGLKNIIAFIPKIEEITNLYESYKFELSGDFYLMYKNQKPTINLESIYGF